MMMWRNNIAKSGPLMFLLMMFTKKKLHHF